MNNIKPDVVQFEGLFSYPLFDWVSKDTRLLSILDEHNIEFLTGIKRNTFLLPPYFFLNKKRVLKNVNHILTVSSTDNIRLFQTFNIPQSKISVIPKGVDIPRFKIINKYIAKKKIGVRTNKKLLNWEPKYSIESGLKKTIDWYSTTHKSEGSVQEKFLVEH